MGKIVDYSFEMIQNMPADSEETDDLAYYANHYEPDADTETKLAILRYQLCLDQDEVNAPPRQVQTGDNQAVSFKTHPNMNKELFANEYILGLKDPNRPFPTGQASDAAGVGLLKWRMQSTDESIVPLTINCWPSSYGNETYVNIEYEATSILMGNGGLILGIPFWSGLSVLLIDNSNRSGSMEFVVPQTDSSAFFPISVRFTATDTFSDLKVTNIIPLKGGNPPKFAQRTQLITENYQVA
ncbi:hypothetical protein P8452_30217 [Trifolium repens]|nr:hypothetical protein P8452_30217 [Trifolium repens]